MNVAVRHAAAVLAAAITLAAWNSARAADINVAVAANFTDAANEIGALWARKTGHRAIFSFGATGALYTQISQGAPFDVFLSADQAAPTRAGTEGLAVANTRFTYAIGKLVLFSKETGVVTGEQTLRDNKFAKLAIAAPAAAPYGSAAVETMRKLGVYDAIAPKIVEGQSIAQAFQFVETGNAQVGFVALSQVVNVTGGSRWVVPAQLYSPINQDAIITRAGAPKPPAVDFIAFLKGSEANQVKEKYGYVAE
jgi:molybdate transport system substrate-binding protein